MGKRNSVKLILCVLGGLLAISIVMAALIPFFNSVLAVETGGQKTPVITSIPLPGEPEDLLVTALYQMEEGSKEITAIYIEVFHVGSSTVSYVEVPVSTRVTLSTDLYKSLQTYSPELPQYMKLSKMAEGFSEEYGLTGCNRILSEVLGVSIVHYAGAEEAVLQNWFEIFTDEKRATGFFEDYTEWIQASASDMLPEERWMYYESWKQVTNVTMRTAPGSQNKDEYMLSGKQSKELLEELMLRTEIQK